ncbi:MAG: helix-turn-helix domain-containing protein [Desulfobacteraceae bacterium]|nr:helix-turn-helix domain-containing protein [Desulfobacteraceae bacterium]
MDIYIIGFDNTFASSILGPMDIFKQADRFCQENRNNGQNRRLTIKLASMDGKPINCQNNIPLGVHCQVADIRRADIIIVTAIHDLKTIHNKLNFMIDWLKEQQIRGATIVSICTGAFLLAEAGLLNGRQATTHWSMAGQFSKLYPKVQIKPEKLVINHNNLYCSAGADSGTDLLYYLLEKYLGHTLAARTAKFFLHDFRRVSQLAYTIYDAGIDHKDPQILNTQKWIKNHLTEPISIKKLSEIACMSQRTFGRRFKHIIGDPPRIYIQKIKVETAKQQLETTSLSFDEISYGLGYKNSSSFRKIFVKWVNLLPSEYRDRFRGYDY